MARIKYQEAIGLEVRRGSPQTGSSPDECQQKAGIMHM